MARNRETSGKLKERQAGLGLCWSGGKKGYGEAR